MSCKSKTKPFHPVIQSRVRNKQKEYDETYVYACNACPRRYKEKKNLNVHIQTMLRQKKFTCDICSESFFRKYHVQRHLYVCTESPRKNEKTTCKQNGKHKLNREKKISGNGTDSELIRMKNCVVKLKRIDDPQIRQKRRKHM